MTEVKYEKVSIEVPAYIEKKNGTGSKISRYTTEAQCECILATISAVQIEC
jgi:hypothetical protein